MKIDGIDGESTDDKHKGWIDVMSFSWGASQTGGSTGGGGGAGKVQFQDFHFTKHAGKGSPLLMLACASGKHMPAVQVVVTRDKGGKREEYLKITLTDVLISSYQQSGDSGGLPVESLSLNFAKIRYDQAVMRPNGSSEVQTATWDLKGNRQG
jgi:type VI secretion system secreted protein Hcp